MKLVISTPSRLHAFFAVATLFFVLSAAEALAVRTPAGAAPINSATDPVTWTGGVEGSVGGPTECDDDLTAFPPFISDAVCSSFFLVATETERIEAVVSPTLPPADPLLAPDLNVFVFACDAPVETAPIIGGPASPQQGCLTPVLLSGSGATPGQSNSGTDERVTFQAVAGVAYEIVTVPGFAFVPTAYNGCAAYDNPSDPTDGECVDPTPTEEDPGPVPATEFLQACGTGSTGNRHVTGGGYFQAPNDKKQHFATHVNRKDDKLKGVLNFKDELTDSRYSSQRVTCAAFNDAERSVHYRGTAAKKVKGHDGSWKDERYCFTARARDGGKQGGSVDEFEVSFFPFNESDDTCNTSPLGAETYGGPVYKGQITYHFQGDDERRQ